MKKFVCTALAVVLLLMSVSAFAEGGQETALETGDRDIAFSNGFHGFCLDVSLKASYTGDVFFQAADTAGALNNRDGSDVSHELKVLFTQCFEQLFVADGSGGYAVKDTNTLQAVVWHYTDSQYVWGEQAALVKAVDEYTGPAIPDSGYTRTLANGDSVTFYFTVMVPQASGQQSFFAYKLEVNREPPHEHSYSEEWKTDGSEHWHECACGDEADRGEHEGGEANCSNRRACEICGEPYGETDPSVHTGATELRNARPATAEEAGYTGDVHCADCGAELTKGEEIPKPHVHDHGDAWVTDSEAHWHECACGDEAERSSHTYEDGKCTACEAEDPNYVPPQTAPPAAKAAKAIKSLRIRMCPKPRTA